MSLNPADTAELAELPQFLTGWPLRAFTGNDAYGAQQLRADLGRLSFLLGGNDGEQLFGPSQQ